MNTDKIIEFAPFIVVILLFIWQNNVFVRPEQLEKKHREILDDVQSKYQSKYVELNAYKEFQNHVVKEIETIKSDMIKGFDEIKEILLKRRKDDM